MSEFDRLIEFLTDEADEAHAQAIGISITLVHPNGREERIERPARLRVPLLTPRQREFLEMCRECVDAEVARTLGTTVRAVEAARIRAGFRLGLPPRTTKAVLLAEAVRLGEIEP